MFIIKLFQLAIIPSNVLKPVLRILELLVFSNTHNFDVISTEGSDRTLYFVL